MTDMPTDLIASVATAIRTSREELGWSRVRLARECGFKDHRTITRMETNPANISASKCFHALAIMGVTWECTFGD